MKPSNVKSMLQALFTVALLTTAFTLTMAAQENSGGTINTLSLDPRQNAELTNSTGTASGQPSDAVDGSQGQENGLVPVTTNMQGSGSNGNMNPPPAAASTASETAATNSATPEASKAAKPGASSSASKTTANPSKTTSNPKK